MSNFPWETGRCVHLVPMPMWPRSDGAEQWSPSLAEPYSPFAPDSAWPACLSYLACWPCELLSSWPCSSPILPGSSYFYSCPTENPLGRPGRAAYRLCNWPCLPLTPGLCSGCSTCLEQLSPNISSGCTLYSGEGLGRWVPRSLQKNAAFYSSAVMSQPLQTKRCWPASGDLNPERKRNLWDWNFPK